MSMFNKNIVTPERGVGIAGLALIAGAALGGCGVSDEERGRISTDLSSRNLNVLSVNSDTGNVTADVSFGDKGCTGVYMADVIWAGRHDDSLVVKLGIPGSEKAVQEVTVDRPSLEVLMNDPAIKAQCFSDAFAK